MTKGKWLAAVAALGLVAAPSGVAAATHKASVKGAKVTRTVKRRVAVRQARAVAPLAQTVVPGAAPAFGAPAPLDPEAYRWLDDADAMVRTVSIGTPDFAFEDAGARRFAWRLADGAMVIAEPMGADETRLYFFAADMTAPFLVRDRLYSFGFDRGRLAAVYDGEGRLLPLADAEDGQAEGAAGLYARGRRLWFAAQAPQPVKRRPVISLNFFAGTDSWREDEGWRAYRRRAGHHDWERRDRDRHDREDRDRWAHRDERPASPPPVGGPDRGGRSHQGPENVSTRPDRPRRPRDLEQPDTTPEQVAVDAPTAPATVPPPADGGTRMPGRRWDGERRLILAVVQPTGPALPSASPASDVRPEERADGGPMRRSDPEGRGVPPARAERIVATVDAPPLAEVRAEAPPPPEVRTEAPPPAPEPRAEAPRAAPRPEPRAPRETFAREKQRAADPNRDDALSD